MDPRQFRIQSAVNLVFEDHETACGAKEDEKYSGDKAGVEVETKQEFSHSQRSLKIRTTRNGTRQSLEQNTSWVVWKIVCKKSGVIRSNYTEP
jgi:hypothetical protein